MVRLLSPVLRRELANLDKDADSRKSAMKALESYVTDMDSKTIPLFLAQVSETKEMGSVSGEYTISLFEVLARVHGVNIVPQIDSIMSTIVKTLASSAGSFPLQQACSKVVPAIARYGIDPTTPENKKRHVIHALCKPLSESLLGSQESITSGAALCLKALVDSDNWRFASDEMVNRVCQKVTVALEEKSTQTNSHMGLVMSLAKHNALIVEAYARLLIQSGLRILHTGISEGNSQKRFSAIQMVNFLMKSLDPRSIYSELDLIIDEMEKCQSDQMAFVSGAAFEASQTARRIAEEEGLKSERESSSVTGSNFGRRQHGQRRGFWGSGERSSASASPESQTLNSFSGCDSLFESPISSRHVSPDRDYNCRSVNRKLWRFENGGVDVSLKDGLFSQLAHRNGIFYTNSECLSNRESDHRGGNYRDEFEGFVQGSLSDGTAEESPISTPQSSPCNHGSPCDANKVKAPENVGVEQLQGGSESVSSTVHTLGSGDVIAKDARVHQMYDVRKAPKRTFLALMFAVFFILLAFGPALVWDDADFENGHLVPT
ncbi:protein SINE1 [Eucalyptus grandis]|uniref:protein SINE1 n=1 Tax=Eucalyptus grandis TaxID=71139 RepID=UPI00192EE719|nr:protein SINE1 [Eucalyptus grandis]XP_010036210.2 protein SINE1 [Eucalyptus grandis]